MRKIVNIKFGSHLYGTSTPASDVDYKSVYIPDGRNILLQRVKGSVSSKRPKAEGEKNYAGEIDEESYSLQRFLSLAAEGQTVALDVLFAPPWSWVELPTPEWEEVVANRHRLITKRSSAFVGYCRQQANKYGIKGSRVAAARAALKFLEELPDFSFAPHGKLGSHAAAIEELSALTDHMDVVDVAQQSGGPIRFWDVCGRKLAFSASIKHAHEVMSRLVGEYGHRALQAEHQQGVDWKALSHAVRVGHQAIELLTTGQVTFPLRNADRILKIKTGGLAYHEVATEIEDLLVHVEKAAEASPLPDEPDHAWIDDFVCRTYAHEAVRWSGPGSRNRT